MPSILWPHPYLPLLPSDVFNVVASSLITTLTIVVTSDVVPHYIPSDVDNVEFLFLLTYLTILQIRAAIRRIRNVGDETNIADALRVARTQVFNPARGDRPGVKVRRPFLFYFAPKSFPAL